MKILIDDMLNKEEKTLYWLANDIGMTYANLWKLANHKTSSIRFDLLEKICIALDCTPSDILEIEKPFDNYDLDIIDDL